MTYFIYMESIFTMNIKYKQVLPEGLNIDQVTFLSPSQQILKQTLLVWAHSTQIHDMDTKM